ncbi:putative copper chaperone CsoZ [Staphylococcus equorum]|uniref:putative copper chaperone CsoZ n=1 Tax=Staphylococcus equorum TaxID=246432 RepID=UPI003EC03FC8
MNVVVTKVIYISGIENETQQKHIEQKLKQLHGVHQVNIEIESNNGKIFIDFETPASLNNLEKEVYDLGYEILY